MIKEKKQAKVIKKNKINKKNPSVLDLIRKEKYIPQLSKFLIGHHKQINTFKLAFKNSKVLLCSP